MNRLALLCAAAALTPAAFAGFTIDLVEDTAFTAQERAGMAYAKSFWESRINGYAASIDTGGLTNPTGLTLYASSGAFGSSVAGYVNTTYGVEGSVYTADTALLEINSASVSGMISAGTFNNAMVRAFGHALGFGHYRALDGLLIVNGLTSSATAYTGANALAAYNDEFGGAAGSVTIAGSDPKGWNATGLSNDLFAASPTNLATATLSATSLAAFRDLGYTTLTAVPEPSAYGAAAGTLGALALIRRRRKSAGRA